MENKLLKTLNFGGGDTYDLAPDWKNVQNKPFETVDSDTLTWDGNTEGKYFLSEASCHVSNFAPPLDELKKGGFFTFSLGSTSEDVPFTSDEIMSADEMGFGSGLTLVTENGNPYIIIVHTPNATASLDGMTLPANVPVGTYFYYGADDDYVKSITINGYNGFKKEVIKEEYLPNNEIPFFDFVEMGMNTFGLVGSPGIIFGDTSEIRNALDAGLIKIHFKMNLTGDENDDLDFTSIVTGARLLSDNTTAYIIGSMAMNGTNIICVTTTIVDDMIACQASLLQPMTT